MTMTIRIVDIRVKKRETSNENVKMLKRKWINQTLKKNNKSLPQNV